MDDDDDDDDNCNIFMYLWMTRRMGNLMMIFGHHEDNFEPLFVTRMVCLLYFFHRQLEMKAQSREAEYIKMQLHVLQ